MMKMRYSGTYISVGMNLDRRTNGERAMEILKQMKEVDEL
jgi:7,8-dihydro-6-hydroxymethylpterin-pyrophosphokinase